MNFKNCFLTMLIGLLPALAQAQAQPCERFNSQTPDGILDRKECEATVAYKAQLAQEAQEKASQQLAFNERMAAEQKAQVAKELSQKAEFEKALRELDQEAAKSREEADQYRRRMEADSAAEERRYAAARRQQENRLAEQKVTCGKDFQKPAIGMNITRARQCVGKLNLASQINRTDGVVSIYRSGSIVLHVMDDRIIAWSR